MTENPVPVSGPAAAGPLPSDPHTAAEHAIGEAVGALETSRQGDLDGQLAAAERVHEVLTEHLGGRPGAA